MRIGRSWLGLSLLISPPLCRQMDARFRSTFGGFRDIEH